MTVEISMRAANIPCRVRVYRFQEHKGNYSPVATDPEEFYGRTELEYKVLDRRGYRAEWLKNKLDQEGLIEEFESDLIDNLREHREMAKEAIDWISKAGI